jgi:hypothetical protein
MNKRMIGWIAALTLLVAGCGAPKPNLATSPEDIVGTWFVTGLPGISRTIPRGWSHLYGGGA